MVYRRAHGVVVSHPLRMRKALLTSPCGLVHIMLRHDTVSERLRRWTRNPLGSARRGSNPLGVVCDSRHMHTNRHLRQGRHWPTHAVTGTRTPQEQCANPPLSGERPPARRGSGQLGPPGEESSSGGKRPHARRRPPGEERRGTSPR